MKSTSWKDTIELVGIVAIVASLIFVGMEMRQAQRIAFAEQQGAQISDKVTLNEIISEHAELILKVNSGADLNAAESVRAERILWSYWSNSFFAYRRWYFLDHPALEAPIRDFARFLYHNPGMRKLWEQKQQLAAKENRLLGAGSLEGGGDRADQLLDEFLEILDRN